MCPVFKKKWSLWFPRSFVDIPAPRINVDGFKKEESGLSLCVCALGEVRRQESVSCHRSLLKGNFMITAPFGKNSSVSLSSVLLIFPLDLCLCGAGRRGGRGTGTVLLASPVSPSVVSVASLVRGIWSPDWAPFPVSSFYTPNPKYEGKKKCKTHEARDIKNSNHKSQMLEVEIALRVVLAPASGASSLAVFDRI